MTRFLWVFLGGGLGSILRYALGLLPLGGRSLFPWRTLAANLLGCFFIGLLAGSLDRQNLGQANLRALLISGFCGGFTTFSTFSAENERLITGGHWALASCYSLLTLGLGLGLVYSGRYLSTQL